MPNPELSLEAKAAIQAYMLRFVIPSAAAVAIISGLFGYVLSGVARIDASAEAAKAALFAAQSAAKAEASAAGASEKALKASDEANISLERARKAAVNADETVKTVNTAAATLNKILEGKYEELATSLINIKGFRESVATIPQSEMSALRSQLNTLENSIYSVAGSAMPAPGGNCPPGTYVVNISSNSVSGGRAGYLESIAVQCRTLALVRPK